MACFVTGKLGTQLASISVVSAIWPAAGVALAGLVAFGTGAWPAVFVGGFLEVLSHPVPAHVALGVAAGQTLAAVAAVHRRVLAVLRYLRSLAPRVPADNPDRP